MIVQCPYCSTRYQLEEERFTAPNPMLKCSRCRHVFPAPGSKKATKAKKAPSPEDESLTLPFEKDSWKDDDGGAESHPRDHQEGFVLGTDEEIEHPAGPSDELVDEPLSAVDELEMVEEAPSADEPDLSFADEDELETELQGRSPRRSTDRIVVRALLIFLIIVVGAYGALTQALFASPALANRLLGPMPVIGTLASERLLARDVTLVGIEGKYQRIKDGSEVFVITGEAVSAAPMTLRSVEVRGRLLDANGEVVREKSIFCGNAVSAKILRELTTREVSVLQKIAPPKQFGIKPGESSPFVIVFMDPPKTAAELSAQVIAAGD
jgi:predicted Zn finger-like uncharacterized protein